MTDVNKFRLISRAMGDSIGAFESKLFSEMMMLEGERDREREKEIEKEIASTRYRI